MPKYTFLRQSLLSRYPPKLRWELSCEYAKGIQRGRSSEERLSYLSFPPCCFWAKFFPFLSALLLFKTTKTKQPNNSILTTILSFSLLSGFLWVFSDKKRDKKIKIEIFNNEPLNLDPFSFSLRRQRMHVNASEMPLHEQTRSCERPFSLTSKVKKIFYLLSW